MEKSKTEVDTPSQLILKDELNKIGKFKAVINFHSEVKADFYHHRKNTNQNNFSTEQPKKCVTFCFIKIFYILL